MRPPRPEERRTDLRKSCLWDGIPDNCPARYREGRAPGGAPAAPTPAAAPDE